MTVAELIEKLQELPQHLEVMLTDNPGPRDCGSPRIYTLTTDDAESVGDCDGRAGERVVVIYLAS